MFSPDFVDLSVTKIARKLLNRIGLNLLHTKTRYKERTLLILCKFVVLKC